jgi:hypothetical protein
LSRLTNPWISYKGSPPPPKPTPGLAVCPLALLPRVFKMHTWSLSASALVLTSLVLGLYAESLSQENGSAQLEHSERRPRIAASGSTLGFGDHDLGKRQVQAGGNCGPSAGNAVCGPGLCCSTAVGSPCWMNPESANANCPFLRAHAVPGSISAEHRDASCHSDQLVTGTRHPRAKIRPPSHGRSLEAFRMA